MLLPGGKNLRIFGVSYGLVGDLVMGLPVLRYYDKLYRKHDIPVQYPDSTKIRKLLGWNPKYGIDDTLTDLVEYWLERV